MLAGPPPNSGPSARHLRLLSQQARLTIARDSPRSRIGCGDKSSAPSARDYRCTATVQCQVRHSKGGGSSASGVATRTGLPSRTIVAQLHQMLYNFKTPIM